MAGTTVHGLNAVRELLLYPGRINRLYFAKESRARGSAALMDEAKAAGVPFDFVPQAKLNSMTDTRDHQGVVAEISPVSYTPLGEVLTACGPQATLVVLDQIQHSRNLGMVIRSAAGAGADAVLLTERGGALLDESVVRASAGTVLHTPVVTCKNLSQTLRQLRDADFWIYGLAGGGSLSLFDVSWPERSALVMGNETKGLRPGVLKQCDEAVSIPLAGGLDSLNVAVAAGIALFSVAAQRR